MRITIICACIALLMSSCATGRIELPEKYVLDDQLESVSYISKYEGHIGWEIVDGQSFILQTRPSDYYLIVLQIPAPSLPFTESISISSSGSMVRAGMDSVTLLQQTPKDPPYIIEKIYHLKEREQVRTIKEQIKAVK